MQNKKADVQMVSYVVLIVISLSLSVMVYSFLRIYVPKDKVECNPDTNLILSDTSCSVSNQQLNITIINKGLFKVDAAYIRFGEESQKIKTQINNNSFLLFNPDNTPGLNPGEGFSSTYTLDIISAGQYGFEIQPAIIRNKQIVLCENAIIKQPIQCK